MNIYIIAVAPVPAAYNDAMSADFQQRYGNVLSPGTRLQARGLSAGPASRPEHLVDYRNQYFLMLLAQEVVAAVLAAEAEGADVVVVDCFGDPGIKEARAVAGIPVFGLCEPTLHFACQLGREFGALVPDLHGQAAFFRWQVHDAGLLSRLLPDGIRRDSKPYEEAMPESEKDPQAMVERLREQSEQLVRDGADVVLVACGGMGAVCDRLKLHHVTVDGRQAPVVTPMPVALKHAEMMHDLQQAQGIPIPSQAQNGFRLDSEDRSRIQRGFGR